MDVQGANSAGNTALIEAASRNDFDKATVLLKSGANPNAVGLVGMTALSQAVEGNNIKMIRLLLSYGANINGVADKYFCISPLGEAAKKNIVEAAQLLLENGADPDSMNAAGKTPLMIAAENNSIEVADLLIQSGAHLDAKAGSYPYNKTALCFAVLAGHEEMTELLLKNKAKVKALNHVKKQIPPKMKQWLRAKEILN